MINNAAEATAVLTTARTATERCTAKEKQGATDAQVAETARLVRDWQDTVAK